ncbi:MAG: hypothetical protein WB710_20480, partial [Stellaceae bacterium]
MDHRGNGRGFAVLNKNDAESGSICLVNNQLWQCALNALTKVVQREQEVIWRISVQPDSSPLGRIGCCVRWYGACVAAVRKAGVVGQRLPAVASSARPQWNDHSKGSVQMNNTKKSTISGVALAMALLGLGPACAWADDLAQLPSAPPPTAPPPAAPPAGAPPGAAAVPAQAPA